MFAQFLKKDEFYDKYMQLYAMRQALANLEMEDSSRDILSPERTLEMFNYVNAFQNVIDKNPERISPYDLIDIADDLNRGIYAKGFRKTQVEVKRAQKFYPPSAREVPQAVYSLFNAYHNIWIDRPIYEKEARFHIELVRIQPFEDGNKRTSRVLTNFNLCKQNKAPVVIPGSDTDEYFSYIDDYNVDGMMNFLRRKSEEEFELMIQLYKNINGNSLEYDPMKEISQSDIKALIMAKRIIDDMGKIQS